MSVLKKEDLTRIHVSGLVDGKIKAHGYLDSSDIFNWDEVWRLINGVESALSHKPYKKVIQARVGRCPYKKIEAIRNASDSIKIHHRLDKIMTLIYAVEYFEELLKTYEPINDD